ncbi:hypothetical protein K8R62_02470 [bacterium]|nr:hypothetical protein [bacterium]
MSGFFLQPKKEGKMKKKRLVKNGKNDCFVEITGKCPNCGSIVGTSFIVKDGVEKNYGYYKLQQSSVTISTEEIKILPECLCRTCEEKNKRLEAA